VIARCLASILTGKDAARCVERGQHADRHRLDLLARSAPGSAEHSIAKKCAGFKSLADAWADTTTPRGSLMLTKLGGLAEFERQLIRVRTGEGRARVEAKGIHMGRLPKLTPHRRR
jgi:DNA invertase Pin-like site-specific DNA recombinase